MLKRVLLIAIGVPVALVVLLIAVLVWYAAGAPDRPELPGRVQLGSAEVEGRERTWILYVPRNLPSPAPLVLALPGSMQTAEALRQSTAYRLEELAERDGFLALHAEAWSKGHSAGGPEWNDCRKNTRQPAHLENVDDVGFLLWLLDRIAQEHPVDRARVYAFGVSDGGQMSYRLATEHPERFAAVAIIVAQQAAPENSSCNDPKGPISVLVMNGTKDPIIPFHGGEASFYGHASAGQVQSIEGTVAHWKRVNGIGSPGVIESLPDRDPDDGSRVTRTTWSGPRGREVVTYVIEGGGHSVPGSWTPLPDFVLGPVNRDISALDEIWSFFQRHRRAR